ncbi:unnamed protein product [Periconia digitata]|uniref:Uncharacterized protein n=1 Tax=Periconia digitata TaxID=1303443 RepID=A0A9W4XW10_9PLEO|nr:unnamed protein product [Periconia digitata]
MYSTYFKPSNESTNPRNSKEKIDLHKPNKIRIQLHYTGVHVVALPYLTHNSPLETNRQDSLVTSRLANQTYCDRLRQASFSRSLLSIFLFLFPRMKAGA